MAIATETSESNDVAIATTEKSQPTKPKKAGGGRPKGFNPLMPFSTTPSLVKAVGELKDKALAELQALNKSLADKSSDDLVALLVKTESVSSDVFAAAAIRGLQRGMLLAETMAAVQCEGKNWTDFYPDRIQPHLRNLSKRSEESYRTLWRRWLDCCQMEADVEPMLESGMGAVELSEVLKKVADGVDPDAAVDSTKAKKSKDTSPIQKVRNAGRNVHRLAAKASQGSDDPKLRGLLQTLNEVLVELDSYYEASSNGVPVLVSNDPDSALVDEPHDVLADAIGNQLESMAA